MQVVRIKYKKECNEYRVPTGSGLRHNAEATAYYTDDKNDAINTARAVYGQEVQIKFWTCYR
jgi:hypothetical protein